MRGEKALLLLLAFTLLLSFFKKGRAVTPEEAEKYLALDKDKTKKIVNSLLRVLTKRWMSLVASSYSDPREEAAVTLLKQGVKAHVLDYSFVYVSKKVGKDFLKAVYKTALFLLSSEKVSFLVEEIEDLSVDLAKKKAINWLLQKELRVATGELPLSYLNCEGKRIKTRFPYFLIFKPQNKKGEVSISFYSSRPLKPALSRGDAIFGTPGLARCEDLPPFILKVKGVVEETEGGIYRWTRSPEIEIGWGEKVPDFDFSQGSFIERRIASFSEDIKRRKTALTNVFTRIKGGFSFLSSATKEEEVFFEPEESNPAENQEKEDREQKEEKEKTQKKKEPLKTREVVPAPPPQKGLSLSDIEKRIAEIRRKANLIALEVEKLTSRKRVLGEQTASHPCSKDNLGSPQRDEVIINEVAWMGTTSSSHNEWIELKNITEKEIDISNWELRDKDDQINILFPEISVPAQSFLLLERTDDDSVPSRKADLIYKGSLNNESESLFLFNAGCELEDKVDALSGWGGGSNSTKKTMERASDFSWQTSSLSGGTPKEENTEGAQDADSKEGGTQEAEEEAEETQEETEETQEEDEEEGSSGGGGGPVEPSWCSQENLNQPLHSPVIINEVAWMGTPASSADEWIEFKNLSNEEVSLSGWQILDKDEQIKIFFEEEERVEANGFYLLERTDDSSVPSRQAQKIYTGGLNNTNETLRLFNEDCDLIDAVEASPDWPGGRNEDKKTMERASDFGWQTSAEEKGTPGRENSEGEKDSQETSPPEEETLPLEVSPSFLSFELAKNATSTAKILLQNPNKKDVSWGVSKDKPWLEIPVSSDSVPSQGSEHLSIFVNTKGLEAGSYNSSIKIEDGSGTTQEVPVTLLVKEAGPSSRVLINEVAWMGTWSDPADEWIELKNASSSLVDLAGWKLKSEDEGPSIDLSGQIPPYGFYLLERTDDEPTSVPADWKGSFGNGLSNSSCEVLSLLNKEGEVVDKTSCSGKKWPAGEGSPIYASMERVGPTSGWKTNNQKARNGVDINGQPVNGTPKALNSMHQTPHRVLDLEVSEESAEDKVVLAWTAPKDENSPREDLSYEIRYSLSPITEEGWSEAKKAKSGPAPGQAGKTETFTITPLLYNRTYYFGLKTRDKNTVSELSNIVSFKTKGEFSPAWALRGGGIKRTFYSALPGPRGLGKYNYKEVFSSSFDLALGEEGRLYLATQEGIYGLNKNYEMMWFFKAEEHEVFRKVLLGPEGLVFGLSRRLVCLDRLGNKLWDFTFTNSYSSSNPLIIDKNIYLFNRCGKCSGGNCWEEPITQDTGYSLFSFSLKGDLNWYFSLDERTLHQNLDFSCDPGMKLGGAGNPSSTGTKDGMIYFDYQNKIWALDTKNPPDPIKWEKEIGSNTAMANGALGPDNHLYVGGDGELVSINTENGSTTWKISLRSWPSSAPVVNNNGIVAVSCCRGYASELLMIDTKDIDPETGKPRVEKKEFSNDPAQPLITDRNIYFGVNSMGYGDTIKRWNIDTGHLESTKIDPSQPLDYTGFLFPRKDRELFILGNKVFEFSY